MTIQLSPICKKIEDSIKALEKTRTGLSGELLGAPTGMKASIAAQIKQLNSQIRQKQKQLEDCNKKHPPVALVTIVNPCLDIKKQVQELQAQLSKQVHEAVAPLQKELKRAAGSQKQSLLVDIAKTASEIRKKSPLSKKIADTRKKYEKCLIDNGGVLGLNAVFEGNVSLVIHDPKIKDPITKDVKIKVHFSDFDRRDVTVTDFPEISETYDAGPPVGNVTTTVTMLGTATGTFDNQSKKITLDFLLFFDHSTVLAGDSRLHIELHTTSALTDKGKIKVEGSSTFEDGYLGGKACDISATGKISPNPLF